MTEKRLTNIDASKELHNKPFRITPSSIKDGKVSFREEYRTGYAYWLGQVKTGKGKPMVGYVKDDKFMTRLRFQKEDFKEDDFSKYTYVHPETKKQANYFEKLFVAEVEFMKPEVFMTWDKAAQKEVPQEFDGAYIAIKYGLYKKLLEQLEDPRSNTHDYFIINYNANAAPANMYVVKFYQAGKPFTTEQAPTTVTTGKTLTMPTKPATPKIFPHEAILLEEVKGDSATKEVLVEYLKHTADKQGVALTPERINVIADAVLVNGVVTI